MGRMEIEAKVTEERRELWSLDTPESRANGEFLFWRDEQFFFVNLTHHGISDNIDP